MDEEDVDIICFPPFFSLFSGYLLRSTLEGFVSLIYSTAVWLFKIIYMYAYLRHVYLYNWASANPRFLALVLADRAR